MTGVRSTNLSVLSSDQSGAPYPRIKDGAAAHGVKVGMAVQATYLDDAITGDLIANECNIIVPEYEMQPAWTQPNDTILDPDAWHYTEVDAIADYATERGMLFKGHAGIWGNASILPAWMETRLATPGQAATEALIDDRISGLARWSNMVELDAVNEPFATTGGGYKTTDLFYVGYGGPGWVDYTLQSCRTHLPNVLIGVNENNMEDQSGTDANLKRATVLTEMTRLVGLGLVDYFGCQTHIFAGNQVQTQLEQTFRPWLASMRALGIPIHLTELDFRTTTVRAAEVLDSYAADRMKRIVGTWAEDMRAGERLILWGVKDDLSWLQDPGNNGGITGQRPLPWDSNGNPKTMERMLRRIFA